LHATVESPSLEEEKRKKMMLKRGRDRATQQLDRNEI